MFSRYSAEEAQRHIDEIGPEHGEDLALRVYTSRLLGGDPRLVLHGGGNTSVKTDATDLLGRRVEVLCVKGSGSDLADVGPEGMPAVRLEPLLALRALTKLGDEATRKAAYAALAKVCRTGTHLMHFAEFAQGFGGWGRGMRKAVAAWFNDNVKAKEVEPALPSDRVAVWAATERTDLSSF